MEVQSVLPHAWDVPKSFRARLGDRAGRQRCMMADGHLLLVLHAAPQVGELSRRGRFFWRHPDGTWRSSEFGGGVAALKRHLGEYADALANFDQREEQAMTAADYMAVLDGVGPLQRAAAHMHQVLQEARKEVSDDRGLINCRDEAYELERTADLLYQATKNGLDFAIAKRAEEEAASSRKMAIAAHRLNALVAMFFPLATLCALFGVNLRHGLEGVAAPLPFLVLLCVGLGTGVVLAYFIVRPPRDG